MGDSSSADSLGRLDQRKSLLSPLRGHAERVNFAPQHVALNQEANKAAVHLLASINFMMADRADRLCLFGDSSALGGRSAAGVDIHRVHCPAGFRESRNAVGGIEPAGKGKSQGRATRLHIA